MIVSARHLEKLFVVLLAAYYSLSIAISRRDDPPTRKSALLGYNALQHAASRRGPSSISSGAANNTYHIIPAARSCAAVQVPRARRPKHDALA